MEDKRDALIVQAYLAEQEHLRQELMEAISTAQRTILLALASASVAVPLLLGQSARGNIPTPLVSTLLYGLTIVYAAIAINLASSSFVVGLISGYIEHFIEAEVNQILEHRALKWEAFARASRRHLVPLMLTGIGPGIAFLFLIILPGGASLVGARYAQLLSGLDFREQDEALRFIASLLPSLSAVAVLSYLVAFIALALSATYWAFQNRLVRTIGNKLEGPRKAK